MAFREKGCFLSGNDTNLPVIKRPFHFAEKSDKRIKLSIIRLRMKSIPEKSRQYAMSSFALVELLSLLLMHCKFSYILKICYFENIYENIVYLCCRSGNFVLRCCQKKLAKCNNFVNQ